MGGEVKVESKLGEGTTFRIELISLAEVRTIKIQDFK
jgi:signal transduction histidine kinase